VVADHLATWCFAPTPTAVANLAAEGITAGVIETGDLMQDLAARVAPEIRGPDALGPAGDALAAAGAPTWPPRSDRAASCSPRSTGQRTASRRRSPPGR
jgi:hypothetical protein